MHISVSKKHIEMDISISEEKYVSLLLGHVKTITVLALINAE